VLHLFIFRFFNKKIFLWIKGNRQVGGDKSIKNIKSQTAYKPGSVPVFKNGR